MTSWLRDFVFKEIKDAAEYLAKAVEKNFNIESELLLKPVSDLARTAKQKVVGDIPVPPKYTSTDFLNSNFWRLRGKLDVPKERWVSFPHCEGEDGSLVIAGPVMIICSWQEPLPSVMNRQRSLKAASWSRCSPASASCSHGSSSGTTTWTRSSACAWATTLPTTWRRKPGRSG